MRNPGGTFIAEHDLHAQEIYQTDKDMLLDEGTYRTDLKLM